MKRVFMSCACALALAGCVTEGIAPAPRDELESEFARGVFKAENGVVLPFRAFTPEGGPAKLPAVVYLHGAGQRGVDNSAQLDGYVGRLREFMRGRDDYKAVILAPQCPPDAYWRDERCLEALEGLIDSAPDRVDPDRVYVTGFSMGGDASWKLFLRRPKAYAAVVPVCGGPLASMEPDVPDVPEEAAESSVWAFNALDDGTVRPAYSKRIFAELWSRNPGDGLNFTLWPSAGHSGDKAYSDRDVWIWAMSRRRR